MNVFTLCIDIISIFDKIVSEFVYFTRGPDKIITDKVFKIKPLNI